MVMWSMYEACSDFDGGRNVGVVGILCCEACLVALEVTTHYDCVVGESGCEAGQHLAHVCVILCSLWEVASDDGRFGP